MLSTVKLGNGPGKKLGGQLCLIQKLKIVTKGKKEIKVTVNRKKIAMKNPKSS